MVSHIFVYGTLRSEARHPQSLFNDKTKLVGPAKVPGKVYDIGPYPGAKLGGDHNHMVGELYEIISDELIPDLDRYEGYYEGDDVNSLFIRRVIEVDGVPAYFYEYNREPKSSFIRSGDWIAHKRA